VGKVYKCSKDPLLSRKRDGVTVYKNKMRGRRRGNDLVVKERPKGKDKSYVLCISAVSQFDWIGRSRGRGINIEGWKMFLND